MQVIASCVRGVAEEPHSANWNEWFRYPINSTQREEPSWSPKMQRERIT